MTVSPLALALSLLLAPAVAGQVPFDHFVVAASGNAGTSPTGLWLVDRLGDPTPVEGMSVLYRSLGTVAVDPASGDVWSSGGFFQSRILTLYRIPMNGRRAGTPVHHQFTSMFAPVADLYVHDASSRLFVLLGGGSATAGLHTMPLSGGNLTMVGPTPNGVELAVDAQAAYVLVTPTGQPSAIWRYDLASGAFVPVASGLPSSSAIEVFASPQVMIGDDAGNLHLVNTTTGQVTLFRSLGIGPIAALRQSPSGQTLVVAESGGWYDIAGTPLGSVPRTLIDVDAGRTDVAWAHTFANGCAGSAGTPGAGTNGLPSLGAPGFAFTVTSALPSSVGLHALGYSRRGWSGVPLPFDLTGAGAPGCAILVNGIVIGAASIDAQGNGALPLPIPNQLVLRGVEMAAQWWILDPAANALGFAFSDGVLAGIR